jgi:hypothetical protein
LKRLDISSSTTTLQASISEPINTQHLSLPIEIPKMAPAVKMWRKRFLIPLWLVQLIVLGIYFVLACVGLSLADNYNDRLHEVLDNSSSSYNYGSYVDNAV